MKLVLFGANGATGRLLTRQVIDAGHPALAVTRRPREFPFTDPQLTVAGADVRDESTLAGLTDGADAVVSTIGVPFTRQSVDIFSVGTRNIVTAMRHNGTQRLVVVSSTGAYPYPHRQNASLSLRIFGPLIARTLGKTVYDDTHRMETIVQNSGLDWTIVRPSILFDLPHRTHYTAGQVEPIGTFTARIDLAHYLTTLASDPTAIHKTVIISTTEHVPTFWQNMRRQSFKPAHR